MADANANARLETFCDGVFAIALTLLVIDIRVPAADAIQNTGDMWRALQRLTPSVWAFVLSFIIILITWVNHHSVLKLVNQSTPSFIYANGFLLLTVVFTPFPTAMLGAFLWTDHAAPAVVIYNAVLAVQAIAWMVVTGTALKLRLTRNDQSTATMRANNRRAYGALAFYSALAVAAMWIPVTIAIVTTMSWIFWLQHGIRMKDA